MKGVVSKDDGGSGKLSLSQRLISSGDSNSSDASASTPFNDPGKPDKHAAASEVAVKLLQYNIFLRPPPINTWWGRERKNERMSAFVKDFLGDFDVVCLQEAFAALNRRRQRLYAAAKRLGFQYRCASTLGLSCCCPRLKLIDGGLVILSKFPIVRKKFLPFADACDIDKVARKGVLFAQIELPNGKCASVFTTHTQASYNFEPSGRSLQVKYAQMDQIADFIAEMIKDTPPDWPVLLTGDFNMDTLQRNCPEYDFMIRALERSGLKWTDVMRSCNKGAVIATTVPFEWKTASRLAIRSALFRGDVEDYEKVSKDKSASADAEVTNSPAYVPCGKTFWANQCLDYVFMHSGAGNARAESAFVDTMTPSCTRADSPYAQISDHSGIVVNLRIV